MIRAYAPTEEQKAIIESDNSALVIAGPGRGKTVTAIAAAQTWLDRNPSQQVLFTSFSNAAVKRIAATAGINVAGLQRRFLFRTFHSVAMEILRDFGRYVGLLKPARVLDTTEEKLIVAERGWNTANETEYHDALMRLAKQEGLVAFPLMIPLASSLLRSSTTIRRAIAQRFHCIVVDEFQDTRLEHWEMLKLIGETSRVICLGDPNQMIYEHEHQNALERMSQFENWKGIPRIAFDGPNFRCQVPAIIRFAEALLNGEREVPSGNDGVQTFAAYAGQRRARLASIWRAIRNQPRSDTATIAFIVPSINTARSLSAELRQPAETLAVPIPIYAHVETDEGALDAFRFLTYAAADWVLRKDDETRRRLAISLAVFGAHWSRKAVTQQRIEAISRTLDPHTRAQSPLRDYLTANQPVELESFADGLLTALETDPQFSAPGSALRRHGRPRIDAASLGQTSLFQSYRLMRTGTGLEGTAISRARTSMLSMYRSKGREFDFVVLVVEPRDHSSRVTLEELRRLYYVSATRARRWLGILHVPRRSGPVLEAVLGR